METYLGKISSISFGLGGYQDAMIGLSVSLTWKGGGVHDFKGFWNTSIQVDKYTEWTETDRSLNFSETVKFIDKLLQDANKRDLQELRGVPVEIVVNNNQLISWRILTEVL